MSSNLFLFFCSVTVNCGTEDNEVGSYKERLLWQKKWKQHTLGQIVRNDAPKPAWSQAYITNGVLHIPYAEIDEPFYAWVDFNSGRSRIDFYGGNNHVVNNFFQLINKYVEGMMRTYQISKEGDYGVSKKIAPFTTEDVHNELTCFQVNGNEEDPVEAQGVLPDITNFTVNDSVNVISRHLNNFFYLYNS